MDSKYRAVYNYRDSFRYLILEDRKLGNLPLSKLKYALGDVSSIDIQSKEGYETWLKGRHMAITSNLVSDSIRQVNLLFDSESILTETDSNSMRSLIGSFRTVKLLNENRRDEYIISFDKPTTCDLIFYKQKDKLYIILICPLIDGLDIKKGTHKLLLQ
jgi:hypothetical protein